MRGRDLVELFFGGFEQLRLQAIGLQCTF